MLKGRCQIWHPDRTHAVLPLRPLPESSERFHLQTPNTDTGWDDQDRRLLFTPRHDFFSLDAGALKPSSLPFSTLSPCLTENETEEISVIPIGMTHTIPMAGSELSINTRPRVLTEAS